MLLQTIARFGAIAYIYQGRCIKPAKAGKCAVYAYDFPSGTLDAKSFEYSPFAVSISVDGICTDGFTAYSLDGAIADMEPHLRQARLRQTMSLDDKIARIHAIESDALTPNGRQFLRRKSKNWKFGDGTSIFIREKDLKPGITFPLLLAAYDWKNGVHDLSFFAERPSDYSRPQAVKALELYDLIIASGVDLLIKQVNYWLRHTPGAADAMKQIRDAS